MKKMAVLSLVLILAALAGYYYVFMKPRFERWLAELFPGAEITCSYVAPLPFANRVYAGNVQIFRKGAGDGDPEFFLYCDSLVHYVDAEAVAPDGRKMPVLALEAKNLAARVAGFGFSLEQTAFAWHVDASPAGTREEDGPEITFTRLEGSGLEVEKIPGQRLSIHSLLGSDCRFFPLEWQRDVGLLKENPWLFLLSRRAAVGELTLQGLQVPGKEDAEASFYSKIRLNGESGPAGLAFHLQTVSELLSQEQTGIAPDTAVMKPGVVMDNLSRINSLSVTASIPWARQDSMPAPAMADVEMKLSLPLVIDVQLTGKTAAPSLADAAAWLEACAHYEPPFMLEPARCLHNTGFAKLEVEAADRGIREKLRNYFSGSGSILYLLDYEGRYGFTSAFLALAHMAFERIEISPELQAGAIMHDIDGQFYPFRPDITQRYEDGRIVLQAKSGHRLKTPGPPAQSLDEQLLPAAGPSVPDEPVGTVGVSEDSPPLLEAPQQIIAPDPVREAAPPSPTMPPAGANATGAAPLVPLPHSALSEEDLPSPVPASSVTLPPQDKQEEPGEPAEPKAPAKKGKQKTQSRKAAPPGEPLRLVSPEMFPDHQFPRPAAVGGNLPIDSGANPSGAAGLQPTGQWVRLW